ncbi:MAG TPA: serine hydrolase [Lacipirellulaceae bacterium]|nr:serine hydrolase [Lacipirellulaceae bacterium]
MTIYVAVLTAAVAVICGGTQPIVAKDDNAPKKSLADVLQPLIERHQGEVGLAVKNLKTGETYAYHADRAMPTASLIKLPVMITTYEAIEKGKLSLNEMITLKKSDFVPGSGILTAHFSPGDRISLRDAIHLMIVYSDNTATNLVLDKLGLQPTNDCMERLGCPDTKINSEVFKRSTSINKERSRQYGLGSTSARDMLKLCELLYEKKLVTPERCKQMLAHMYECDDKLKVPRLLPPGTRVAHKTGSVNASRTDAGIMETPAGPIAYCILTDKNKDQRWTDDNAGDAFCANVGAAIYHYFNPKDKTPIAMVAQKLESGASGDLVEALQRTLNARLKSSSKIGVDGDFGPETEGAVKQFQKQEELKPTGVVDSATWKALGPLIMEDQPVREPAVVNAEKSQKMPPDPLDGSPFVTCKAWAIVDGDTGKFLAGEHEDVQRDPASTTKMMTAYLVASLAEKDPSVLQEIVTFSERADKTPGSTSDVKAGEKLSVGELMYGMLLPSGNDAAVAFAEHFGKRLADAKDKEANLDAHDCFVSAMNRKAKELGMTRTHFNNPNGLPSRGHQTTARDLARLAYEAFQVPEFRKVVGTVRHGCTLDSVTGYKRNIEWHNTNQLLKIKGYEGIKTGTTGAAGSCLVSTGERGGHRLIIVVLGATSTEGRYADTRNLYRWAWNDLVKLGSRDAKTAKAILEAN